MSCISGVSRPAWPPLRMSYSDEVRPARTAEAEPAEVARDRAQALARTLDQRLTGTLAQIRSSVFGVAAQGPASANSPVAEQAAAGSFLDILA